MESIRIAECLLHCREGQTNVLCGGCQITLATAIEMVVNQKERERDLERRESCEAAEGRGWGEYIKKHKKEEKERLGLKHESYTCIISKESQIKFNIT